MSENFYTNFLCIRDKIFYRGFEDGKRICKKFPYKPSLFVDSDKPTKWTTLSGKHVDKITFSSPLDAKDFINRYDKVDNFNYYGNNRFQYTFIADKFSEMIEYDLNRLVIANIDIEVGSDSGFAKPADPFEEVIAITIESNGTYISFGCGEYVPTDPSVKYIKCESEVDLLTKFIEHWEYMSPDIVTGWNVEFYDIPYLYTRIERILGESFSKRLSPWRIASKKDKIYNGSKQMIIDLVGVAILDYMDLYIRFRPKRESNKLNYISYIELGEKKISYEEYGNLSNLYKTNFTLFMDYNVKDVELVKRLEEKLKLIEMVVALAYDAKVNFVDVFSQVRLWDAIIFNYLKKKNIAMPKIVRGEKNKEYSGAFVKDIDPSMKEWVVSFDLNSLYPSLQQQFNISPECLLPEKFKSVTVEKLLSQSYDTSFLKDENVGLAANGHCFSNDRIGFLPDILMRMYEDRKMYKNKMIDSQKELERVKEEIYRRKISK